MPVYFADLLYQHFEACCSACVWFVLIYKHFFFLPGVQHTNSELTPSKMPKKTNTSDKKSLATTKLFRSMSLSSRKQSASRDHSADEDRRNSPSPSDSEKINILIDQKADLLIEKNDALEGCNKIKIDLQKTNAKLRDAEREIENLKVLLASSYRVEINEMSREEQRMCDCETDNPKNVIYPSKMEQHETTIEASAVPFRCPSPCKECERLRDSRNKSVIEVIALRKYVQQLSEVLSEGDQRRKNFLNDFEKKLIAAQTEKEIALEELAHVIDQRDQLVRERDKAQEEWGKAAGKWENTLDQLDSLVRELNQVGILFYFYFYFCSFFVQHALCQVFVVVANCSMEFVRFPIDFR